MYAPWAFYMGIWALYNSKLPIWPLIGLPDLAGDLSNARRDRKRNNVTLVLRVRFIFAHNGRI